MDNASGVRFVSLTFLIGFGIGTFVGVGLAILAVAIGRNDDPDPVFIEVPVFPTATATTPASTPASTPLPQVVATTAAAVRVGPGEAFATFGTVSTGDILDVVGRDFDAEWIAIRFPPGSGARGWIPVDAVDELSFASLRSLDVLLPTPLPVEIVTPPPFVEQTPDFDDGTATPQGTPTTMPTGTDLEVLDVDVQADGRIRVLVHNRGPEDLTSGLIVVTVRTINLQAETINRAQALPAGAVLAMTTNSFSLGPEPERIQVVLDPSSLLDDPDRENNVFTATLEIPATPTPTPQSNGSS